MSLKRIAVVLPFFGKFPSYFPLWLISVKFNPTIDWLLFTDDHTPYDYPDNVKVHYTSFCKIKERLQSIFDFKIKLESPWGLCAFRPCYGDAFVDYLHGYDFWGYCDCDLIFGDIRNFLTEEVLDTFDKILWLGHFSLIRNTAIVNKVYRLKTRSGEVLFRRAFESADVSCFDEVGLNDIFANNGYRIYQKVNFADFKHRSYLFDFIIEPEKCLKTDKRVFTWNCGKLNCHEMDNDVVESTEYLYIHFCRRPMSVVGTLENMLRQHEFAIVPGKFIEQTTITATVIRKYTRSKVYWEYILPRLKPDRLLLKRIRQALLETFAKPTVEEQKSKYWLTNGRS